MRKMFYAAYEGDEIRIVGTMQEIADYFEISIYTAQHYMTPTWKQRGEMTDTKRTVYRIEEE